MMQTETQTYSEFVGHRKRRAADVLGNASGPAIHFSLIDRERKPNAPVMCGRREIELDRITDEPGEVTCRKCRSTTAWHSAETHEIQRQFGRIHH